HERINRADVPEDRLGYLAAAGRALEIALLSTRDPMRAFSLLSGGAALLSVLYSVYVFAILLLKNKVAEGWASLSLQKARLFFLLFVVLAMLCEYISRMFSHTQARAPYFIKRETSSLSITSRSELNVVRQPSRPDPAAPGHPAGDDRASRATP